MATPSSNKAATLASRNTQARSLEARYRVADTISEEILARPDAAMVPDDVLEFLSGPWAQVVAHARISNRPGISDADGFAALIPVLIWSVQPGLARKNQAMLVRQVPKLVAKLREGLATIQYPEHESFGFFEVLMSLHERGLRSDAGAPVTFAAMLDESTQPAEFRPDEFQTDPFFADSVQHDSVQPESRWADSVLPDPSPVEPIPPKSISPKSTLPKSVLPDSRLLDSMLTDSKLPNTVMPDSVLPDSSVPDPLTAAAVPPASTPSQSLPEVALLPHSAELAGAVVLPADTEPSEPAPDAVPSVGDWVELRGDSDWRPTRLTWTNPGGTLFLFTGASGSTQSMTRRSLDKLLASGRIRSVK